MKAWVHVKHMYSEPGKSSDVINRTQGNSSFLPIPNMSQDWFRVSENRVYIVVLTILQSHSDWEVGNKAYQGTRSGIGVNVYVLDLYCASQTCGQCGKSKRVIIIDIECPSNAFNA